MAGRPSEAALTTQWHELLEKHARVSSALERALAEHELGVSEFEVLAELATAPTNECRMQHLSGTVHLSQSALSRVVARLEEQGLVTRFMCKDDRRGIFASLTAEGKARYEQAKPAHRQVLADHLG
jgi:DNA-binding MarR family transcriptional regulator